MRLEQIIGDDLHKREIAVNEKRNERGSALHTDSKQRSKLPHRQEQALWTREAGVRDQDHCHAVSSRPGPFGWTVSVRNVAGFSPLASTTLRYVSLPKLKGGFVGSSRRQV